ncbi:MAG TPA: preprotein translocase subunit SecB [Lachnospiraceae bacterium]|jgi:preprotein translocase subunit SecB|nr:preprotein translocase subunit SecB [Lachnospiraceae bacterium]HIS63509.1 protein-export chaperone SecB [Candidatus Scybalomonas excrementigallinarum]
MEVRSKYESPLILDKIEIVESTFRKKETSLENLELGVQVEHNLTKIDEDRYEVILLTTVSDKDEKVYVNVKGRAIFSTEQENMNILEKNTIAIIFPYIRSYISIITTQPGMEPIVLPAMNIVAMINDQKK